MAVKATFQADFSNFTDAVNKAQVQLKGFEGDAGKVETSLNRMVNNFSGVKLIQQATLTADAVDKIGGSAKLTDAELQKVAKQADEAAQKLKALGTEVPPKIQALADQLKQAPTALERIAETAGAALGSFVAFSAIKSTFEELVKGSLDLADQLDNLSKATGLSTDDLQGLGFAGKRVGVDLDEIGNIVGQMSKRIGTGDESAVGAIQSLGLSLKDLRALSPADQFITIADAVGKIEDPIARAGVGSELFGKKFQAVLQLSQDGLRQTIDQAKQFGAVLDKDSIKTLDDFGDKLGDLGTTLKVLAAQALAPVIGQLGQLLGIAKQTSQIKFIDPDQQQQFKQFGAALGSAANTDLSGFGHGLTLVGQAATDLAAGNNSVITSAQRVQNTLNALRANAVEPLTKAQADQIAELERYGKSTKDIAALVGVSEGRVKSFEQAEKDAAKAAAQAAADAAKLAATLQLIEGTKADLKVLSLAEALERIGGSKFVPSIKDVASESVRSATDVDGLRGSIEDLQRSGLFLEAAMVGVNKQFATLPNVVPQATAALADARKEADGFGTTLGTELDGALKNVPKVLEHAFTGGGGLQGAVKAIGVDIGSAIGKSVSDEFGASLTKNLGDTLGGVIKDILPGFGALLSVGLNALFKIGGPSQAEVAGRQLESQFELSFGGLTGLLNTVGAAYIATGRSAQQAQADVKALLDAEKQGGPAVQAAIDKINGVLAEQAKHASDVSTNVDDILDAAKNLGENFPDALKPMVSSLLALPGLTDDEKKALENLLGTNGPDFKALTATAANYGLTLDQLGPKFEQANISDRADQIEKDFNDLTGAGADADHVLGGMATSINGLVNDALKFGSSLPTALKPLIQQLFDTGQLTDSTGKKLDSISGLTFDDSGDPLAQSLKTLTGDLDRLVNLLADGLPTAAKTAADGIAKELSKPISVPINFTRGDDGGAEPARAAMGGYIQAFAGGGHVLPFTPRGTDTVPAMLTPGELVLNRKQQQEVFGAGGVGNPIHIEVPVVIDGYEVARIVNDVNSRNVNNRIKQSRR